MANQRFITVTCCFRLLMCGRNSRLPHSHIGTYTHTYIRTYIYLDFSCFKAKFAYTPCRGPSIWACSINSKNSFFLGFLYIVCMCILCCSSCILFLALVGPLLRFQCHNAQQLHLVWLHCHISISKRMPLMLLCQRGVPHRIMCYQ